MCGLVVRRLFWSQFILVVGLNAAAQPAYAIPSPELVIGSVSSLAQVGAFFSALLGGGLLATGHRLKGRGAATSPLSRIAVLVLTLSCAFLLSANLYQYFDNRAESQARLQATLTRPAQTQSDTFRDPALSVTSFDNQTRHQNAVTTDEALSLLFGPETTPSDIVLVDIREGAENATGTIPGASHIRFPDFNLSGEELEGKQVLLFCHNGNRSSETCERLAKLGVDCRFIAGGLEKWIVEGRPFTDESVRSLADLRAIPNFANSQTLLTTASVHALANEENSQFIDVRYPAEFARGHLPGAINIPLRALPTETLLAKIAQLRDQPIIAPCYDRRGCFMAQVLGYELTKAGFDFRGRYTVPWEFFKPRPLKPHIALWLDQQNQSSWTRATEFGANKLADLTGITGPILALFLLSLASRLLVLPIAVKSEKDQILQRRLEPELIALKKNNRNDPVLRARAFADFHTRHGLTPMRNLLALAFLPVMMLGLASVQKSAAFDGSGFGWVTDLGTPDSVYLLPVIFVFLALAYLVSAAARTRRQRAMSILIGGPVLLLLTAGLNASGCLYLCFSMSLLIVQRAVISGRLKQAQVYGQRVWRRLRSRLNYGLVRLDDQMLAQECGNKAYRLSVAKSLGVEVPKGLIIPFDTVLRYQQADGKFRQTLHRAICRRFGDGLLAVRSSGGSEDSSQQSFAGIYASVLNVNGDTLGKAILAVAASFQTDRAQDYASDRRREDRPNILIQRMIDAEFSGVLFTRDLFNSGLAKLEMVTGVADRLVSGQVTPESREFGRYSCAPLNETDTGIDFTPLLRIGQKLEHHFGNPQDIEWAYAEGRFHIVQSRDITATGIGNSDCASVSNEWHRIFAQLDFGADSGEPLFSKDEMAEVLPMPTPLSLEYMNRLWENGGSVDLACRELGLKYYVSEETGTHLVTLFGRLYSDVAVKRLNSVRFSKSALRRIRRDADGFATRFHTEFSPGFLRRMEHWERTDLDRFTAGELVERVLLEFDDYSKVTHVEVEKINIAASCFLNEARLGCEASGLDPARFMGTALVQPEAGSEVHGQKRDPRTAFAHRSEFDYELSQARFSETGRDLAEYFGIGVMQPDKTPIVSSPPEACPESVKNAIARVSAFQLLKEEAKDVSLRQVAFIRRLLVCLDQKLQLNGLVFYLFKRELMLLGTEDEAQVLARAKERWDQREALVQHPPLRPVLTIGDLERASARIGSVPARAHVPMAGKRIAGRKSVSGPAYVADVHKCELGGPLPGFGDGDILVCASVHPDWLGEVLRSGGVVSEVGGWLSHIAIIARENDIPMIVGSNAFEQVINGALLTLGQDGSVIESATAKPDFQEILPEAHLAKRPARDGIRVRGIGAK